MAIYRRVLRAVAAPFWNSEQARPRAFWRALVPVVVILAGVVATSVALGEPVGYPYLHPVTQLPRVVIALGVLAVMARFVDRRPLREYGFSLDRDWWVDLAGGIAIATVVHFAATATKIAMGWATITAWFAPGNASFGVGVAVFVLGFVFVAVWEEVAFRSILFTNAADGFTRWTSSRTAVVLATLVTAVLFGVIHLNQAPSPLAITYWIVVGAIPTVAYALTGELALPIGLHFAYNFAGNNLFDVAGTNFAPSVIHLSITGPESVAGLAGVVDFAWGIAGVLLVVAWVRWRTGDVAVASRIADWQSQADVVDAADTVDVTDTSNATDATDAADATDD